MKGREKTNTIKSPYASGEAEKCTLGCSSQHSLNNVSIFYAKPSWVAAKHMD